MFLVLFYAVFGSGIQSEGGEAVGLIELEVRRAQVRSPPSELIILRTVVACNRS